MTQWGVERRRPWVVAAATDRDGTIYKGAFGSTEQGRRGGYLTQLLPFADKKSLPLYFECEHKVYRHLA